MGIQERYLLWLQRLTKRRSRQGLYEFLETELRNIDRGARVLCVGAGGEIGALLAQQATARGFTTLSVDIDAATGADRIGDICEAGVIPGEFDAVVMCEVLEHVAAPHRALANIHAALRPGGRLILSTPFMLPIHAAPGDYYRFTRHGLALLLKDFHDVSITGRNTYFEAIDVLWLRLLQCEGRPARRLSLFVVPLVYYLKRPLTLLLGWLVRSDAMTTGYVATATR